MAIVLNIPASNGVGAASDVSGLDPAKTFIVGGTLASGEVIVIEGTADPTAVTGWAGLAVFAGNQGNFVQISPSVAQAPSYAQNLQPGAVLAVVNFIRVKRSSALTSTAAPTVTVDSTAVATQVFQSVTVPAGSGSGAQTNVAAQGTTIQATVSGVFGTNESLLLEGSPDGVNFDTIFAFTGPGTQQTVNARYSFVRVTRQGVGSNPQALSLFLGTSSAGAGGGGFPGFGTGVAGPTAVGAQGVAGTARRSDQTGAAYRSDTLSTTWFIDPVAGSDAAANGGTTNATALLTRSEFFRRCWGYHFTANTTITLLGNLASTDIFAPFYTVAPGIIVTFIGSLGATTGFGGRVIDNTLFTGTVTAFAASANAPTADDIEMTDTSIPVSFTASGLMASGVIFRRNSGGATAHWQAAKDLGAKTIRMGSPVNNAGQNNYQTLTVGDGYSAYQTWQWFGVNWPTQAAPATLVDTVYDVSTSLEQGQNTPRRRRVWLGTQTISRAMGFAGWVNCCWEVTAGNSSVVPNDAFAAVPALVGGIIKGPGNSVISIFRDMVLSSCVVMQGATWAPNDQVLFAIEGQWQQHDCTVPCLFPTNNAHIQVSIANPAGGGMSGKGNTSKILQIAGTVGDLAYDFSGATPPFIAGVTTDANPITINGANYTVANLPTTVNTNITTRKNWPDIPALTSANGAQLVVIGATGPAAIVTPGAPAGWRTFRDAAGVLCYYPYWQ